MLRSHGAPAHASYLCRTWSMRGYDGFPWYASDDDVSIPMQLVRENDRWIVCDDVFVYAVSESTALHPNTVYQGEWHVLVTICEDRWEVMPDFYMRTDMTRETPMWLGSIGRDFFTRCYTNMPFWFTDDETLPAFFSGCNAPDGSVGKRYCNVCDIYISAKNFSAQHMRNKHPRMVYRELRRV